MIVEGYKVRVLSLDGVDLGWLDGVRPGGRLTGNVDATVRWSGSITVTQTVAASVEWTRVRLQPVHIDGEGAEVSLGVFIPLVGKGTDRPEATTVTVDLYDRTMLVSENALGETFTVAAGSNPVKAASSLLAGFKEAPVGAVETGVSLPSALVWKPEETTLRAVNDLLDAAGYFALFADRDGVFQLLPYREPSGRPVVHRFDPGPEAVHTARLEWVRDANRPNRVVAVSQESGEVKAMTSVVTNTDPASPFSYPSVGRWVTKTYTGVEAATQDVLDAYAKRMLARYRAERETRTRECAFLPLNLNDVVEAGGVCEVVEGIDITMTPGQLMKVETRKVA
ncbi:hypothetical protein [Trueperella pyogenes]|uniref:hypothetical protein n=1 Tax=Trueperella pyogenes TaxID=1661 RepID=UPI0023DDD790|nr:hypothetical protein [Trueperella pyogenes]